MHKFITCPIIEYIWVVILHKLQEDLLYNLVTCTIVEDIWVVILQLWELLIQKPNSRRLYNYWVALVVSASLHPRVCAHYVVVLAMRFGFMCMHKGVFSVSTNCSIRGEMSNKVRGIYISMGNIRPICATVKSMVWSS